VQSVAVIADKQRKVVARRRGKPHRHSVVRIVSSKHRDQHGCTTDMFGVFQDFGDASIINKLADAYRDLLVTRSSFENNLSAALRETSAEMYSLVLEDERLPRRYNAAGAAVCLVVIRDDQIFCLTAGGNPAAVMSRNLVGKRQNIRGVKISRFFPETRPMFRELLYPHITETRATKDDDYLIIGDEVFWERYDPERAIQTARSSFKKRPHDLKRVADQLARASRQTSKLGIVVVMLDKSKAAERDPKLNWRSGRIHFEPNFGSQVLDVVNLVRRSLELPEGRAWDW